MTKSKILFFFILYYSLSISAQKSKKGIFNVEKIGFLYNFGTEENFIYNDKDYTYTTNTFKGQVFYNLGNWKSLDFELIVQPQYQILKHQLINEHYILPSEENYQQKRVEFTKFKTMHLYVVEFGFAAKKKLSEKLNLQGAISLGFSYIDTRSERLAKGFTFIENFSVGFSYKTTSKTFLYLGTNFGHVSNLNFLSPNDGYNILGLEIGISYKL
ncbi:MAG: acyloxyacyl hydrolase [Polaribacter sp.]|uniref:acyloxyacyl hydrolase n=1 Tax=Polaribacter sp. TaxID=1920175 RepID=UPI002F35638C